VTRLRLLAGLLGCLAVLATGVSVAAFGALPSRAMAAAPCDEPCTDCKGTPCAPTMAVCGAACIAAAPAMVAIAFDLPTTKGAAETWLPSAAALDGLTKPPDPFPPRA
jgi:hypothetical protein